MPRLEVVELPLEALAPYHRNPRRGDVGAIASSLQEHGLYRPIVVNLGTKTGRPNEILAGNHTALAARSLGWETIEATTLDVDEDAAARIVLVDNRASDTATYDDHDLLELLQSLDGLEGTGYADDDLEDLLSLLGSDDLDDLEDEYGEPEPEDLWPTITLKVPKPLHAAFWAALEAEPGETDPQRLERLLGRLGSEQEEAA